VSARSPDDTGIRYVDADGLRLRTAVFLTGDGSEAI